MDKYDPLLLKNQLCFPTYAAANKIIRRYQPLLKKLDLTYTQYVVMMVMWEKEVVNEKDLVNRLYLQANTLNPLLKKLKEKEYLSINKDKEDKRNLIIALTSKGRDLKEKAIDVPLSLAQEPWLTVEEAKEYRRLLYKIINEGKEIENENCD
ncbi:MAG: MarR family transcriptional regulator [Bacilli bacterium]|nr:MarR family transcriptional regulator [Bacilli bacterium]